MNHSANTPALPGPDALHGPCDVVVIGGGPSGLFTALHAANSKNRVLLLEKQPACGKKLLITGSGQCNLTHDGPVGQFLSHYGEHGSFLRPALMNWTNHDLAGFFEHSGVRLVTTDGGKIFPLSGKASDILQVLLAECRKNQVRIHCSEPVTAVRRNQDLFAISTVLRTYQARVLVIACGGASYPGTGSTGDGYAFASGLGHTVTKTAPALCAVYTDPCPFSDLAGISFHQAEVTVTRDGRQVHRHSGDLLLTHNGLSGPVILDMSRYIREKDQLIVSFLHADKKTSLEESLIGQGSRHGQVLIKTVLIKLGLPERFGKKILIDLGVPPGLTCAHLSKDLRREISQSITAYPFTVSRLGGYHEAMVTRGGVALTGVSQRTMQSRIHPGLFFVGEVLDIDGDTGGYNLQAAFSTAKLAAREIQRILSG